MFLIIVSTAELLDFQSSGRDNSEKTIEKHNIIFLSMKLMILMSVCENLYFIIKGQCARASHTHTHTPCQPQWGNEK